MSASRRRAPTIPDRNSSYGYALTAEGTYTPLTNPLKDLIDAKNALLEENALKSSYIGSEITQTSKQNAQSA